MKYSLSFRYLQLKRWQPFRWRIVHGDRSGPRGCHQMPIPKAEKPFKRPVGRGGYPWDYPKALQYIYYREKVYSRFLFRRDFQEPSAAPITDIIVKFDRPASPVPVSFGSVVLNKRAIIQFAVTDHIASASFGIHVSAYLDQIVDHVVFRKEKLVAAPMSIFHPGTVTIFLAIVSAHSHRAGQIVMSECVETIIHHAINPSEGIN